MTDQNNLSIIIEAKLDNSSQAITDLNGQIRDISKQLNGLNLNIDTKSIENLSKQVTNIQNQITQQGKNVKFFDAVSLNQALTDSTDKTKKLFTDIKSVISDVGKEYSQFGKIKFPSQTFDPITKELTNFTLEIEKADKTIEKLKFDLIGLVESGREGSTPAFLLQGLKGTDNTVANLESQLKSLQVLQKSTLGDNFKFNNSSTIEDPSKIKEINSLYADYIAEITNAISAQKLLSTEEMTNLSDKRTAIQNVINSQKQLESSIQQTSKEEQDATKLAISNIQEQLKQIKILADAKVTSATDALNKTKQLMQEESDLFSKNIQLQLQGIKQVADMQSKSDAEKQAQLKNTIFPSMMPSENSHSSSPFGGTLGMASTMLSFTALSKVFDDFQKGVVDISSSSAKLQQVFGENVSSQQQLNQATDQFIGIAKTYGKSIQDVMDSAVLWGRQYKDLNTVMTLTNQSTLLAVVDNMKVADANKAVESSMNALGMSAKNSSEALKNSGKLIDSWSAVSHGASVSAQDLTGGFERSAAAAHIAGLSIDQLNSLIASGVRNTGRSGDAVGNMWKSVLANIDSETPKVQKAFEGLGIQIEQVGKNGQTEMRPMFDIITQLSQKVEEATSTGNTSWNKYFEAIAGGKYQYDTMLAALSNTKTLTDTLAISQNSQGQASKLAQQQMHTMAAELQRLHDTLQQLAHDSSESGLGSVLKDIVVGVTDLINGLNHMPKFVDWGIEGGVALLGLAGIIKTITTTTKFFSDTLLITKNSFNALKDPATLMKALFLDLTGQTENLAKAEAVRLATSKENIALNEAEATSIGAKTVAIEGETVAMAGMATEAETASVAMGILDGLMGGLPLILTAITTGFAAYSIIQGESAKNADELNQTNKELIDTYSQNKDKIDELVSTYKGLSNQTILSESNQQKLNDTSSELNKLMPQLTDKIDAQGKVHLKNVDAIDKEIQKTKELIDIQSKKTVNDNNSSIDEQSTNYQNILDQTKKDSKNRFDSSKSLLGVKFESDNEITAHNDKILEDQQHQKEAIDTTVKSMGNYINAVISSSSVLSNLDETYQNYLKNLAQESESKLKTASSGEQYKKITLDTEQSIVNQANAIDTFVTTMQGLDKGLKDGSISQGEFNGSITNLKTLLQDAGVPLDVVNGLVDKYVNHIVTATGNMFDLNKAQQNLSANFDDYLKQLDPLNNAIDTLNKGHELSHSTILKLLTAFPDLNSKLTDHNGLLQLGVQALTDERDAQVKTFSSEMDGNNKTLQSFKDALGEKLKGYQIDIDAIQDVASATKQIMTLYDEYQQKFKASKQYGPMIPKESFAQGVGNYNGVTQDIANLGKYKEEIANLGKELKNTNGATENSTNTTSKFDLQLAENNDLMKQATDAQKRYVEGSSDYSNAIDQQISLLKDKKAILQEELKLLNDQADAQSKVSDTNNNSTTSETLPNANNNGEYQGAFSTPINDSAKRYGLDPFFVAADIAQESGFKPDAPNGGLFQLSGDELQLLNGKSVSDPVANIDAGSKLFKEYLDKYKDPVLALAAYNMGPGVVDYFSKHGGYSVANMQAFSDMQKKEHGYNVYGDPEYVDHVNARYKDLTGGNSIPGVVSTSSDQTALDNKMKALQIKGQISDIDVQIEDANYKKATASLKTYEDAITTADQAQKTSQNTIADYPKYSKEYRDEIDKQVSSLKEKQNQTHLEADQVRVATGKDNPYGLNPAQLDELSKKIPDLQMKWQEYQKQINSLSFDKVNSVFEEQNKVMDDADSKIQLSQTVQKEYANTSQQYRDEIAKQIPLYVQKEDAAHKEADAIREAMKLVPQNSVQYDQLSKSLQDVTKKYWEAFDGAKAANNALEDSKLATYDKSITKLNTQLSHSKDAMSMMQVGTTAYNTELGNQMSLEEQISAQLKQKEADLRSFISTLQEGTTAYETYTKQLNDTTSAEDQSAKSLYDMKMSIANDAVTAEKDAYSALKDAALKSIDARMKAEDDRHKQVTDNLNAEMQQFQDSIDAQTKAIDTQSATDDYNQQLSDAQKTAQDTQNQINVLSLDDSIEAKAQRLILSQQLATQQEAIAKLQSTREKDLRKQNLQDQLSSYKTSIDAQKTAEDTMYQSTKDSLDKQKTATTDYYDNIINDQQKWNQMTQDILKGNVTSVKASLTSLSGSVQGNMKLIGKSITNNLVTNLQNAVQLMDQLNALQGIKTPSPTPVTSTSSSGTNSTSVETFQGQPIWTADSAQKALDTLGQEYNDAMAKGDKVSAQQYHDQANQIRQQAGMPVYYDSNTDPQKFDTGGYTGNFGGDPKWALLDSKELVLKEMDTSNILKVVDIVRNLSLPNISGLLSKIGSINNNNSNKSLQFSPVLNVTLQGGTTDLKSQAQELTNIVLDSFNQRLKQYGFN